MDLKYDSFDIVFQEVPDETSLAINITGCPYKCEGCHSKHLWEDIGLPLVSNLKELLSKYEGMITCVCFMGGDQNPLQLLECLRVCKNNSLNTCLYTGCDDLNRLQQFIAYLDYLKTGRFNIKNGPLSSPNTNQRFYKKDMYGKLIDATPQFYRKVSRVIE